jgi:ABC-type phosphate/phosphonate transport system ATPase subunit
MHKTSIHVSLKEIRGEIHSNTQNHTKNKGTKNKHKKTMKFTTPNLLYKPGKIHKVLNAALASIPLNKSLMKLSC